MPWAYITGTGSCLPKKVLTNFDLEKIVDTNDDWITRRSGIKERRIAAETENESAEALASNAAREALDMAGCSVEDIDIIIAGTVSPDRAFPGTACMVQKNLGASKAAAFDVSAGCSGFLYAMYIARNSIMSGSAKKTIVIGIERMSRFVNWEDRSTCVLMGDGAGAVVIEAKDCSGGIMAIDIKSDGSLWDLLYAEKGSFSVPDMFGDIDLLPFHLKMEGNKVFKFAVECMVEAALKTMADLNLKNDDIKLVIPHQANIRIIHAIAKGLDLPDEKVFVNIHRYGNMSAATIPVALDEACRGGLIAEGDHILLLSFGAGLTWGSAIVKWCNTIR